MPSQYVVLIGGSAGAVEPLKAIVSGLPEAFPAAIVVAIHHSARVPSVLPQILRRSGPLPAFHAASGDRVAPGRIYVAPPGYHLVFSDGEMVVSNGPRENWQRPSIDVLFRSGALAYDSAAIGVLISGTMDDGAAGLAAIKLQGGTTIVQDPEEALFSDMPTSAVSTGAVDHVLRAAQIPSRLSQLVERRLSRTRGELQPLEPTGTGADDFPRGAPAQFACPECNGTLFNVDVPHHNPEDRTVTRFRCRVGHAFSAETLLSLQSDTLEGALWTALRALEEQIDLGNRLVARSRQLGLDQSADRLEARNERSRRCSTIIRNALSEIPQATDVEPVTDAEPVDDLS